MAGGTQDEFYSMYGVILESFPNHNLAGCLSCVKFHADSCPWAPFLLIFKHSKVTGQSNLGKLPFLIIDCVGLFFDSQELLGSVSDSNQTRCSVLAGATAFQRTHAGFLILMQSVEFINRQLYVR